MAARGSTVEHHDQEPPAVISSWYRPGILRCGGVPTLNEAFAVRPEVTSDDLDLLINRAPLRQTGCRTTASSESVSPPRRQRYFSALAPPLPPNLPLRVSSKPGQPTDLMPAGGIQTLGGVS